MLGLFRAGWGDAERARGGGRVAFDARLAAVRDRRGSTICARRVREPRPVASAVRWITGACDFDSTHRTVVPRTRCSTTTPHSRHVDHARHAHDYVTYVAERQPFVGIVRFRYISREQRSMNRYHATSCMRDTIEHARGSANDRDVIALSPRCHRWRRAHARVVSNLREIVMLRARSCVEARARAHRRVCRSSTRATWVSRGLVARSYVPNRVVRARGRRSHA
jgi:hypothetical protein